MISDKAVEAAARGMFAEEHCDRRQREDVEGNWNSRLNDEDKAEYRALARAALEAAAPHIRLAILREEISLGDDWQVEDPRISYVDVQVEKETYLEVHGGRE